MKRYWSFLCFFVPLDYLLLTVIHTHHIIHSIQIYNKKEAMNLRIRGAKSSKLNEMRYVCCCCPVALTSVTHTSIIHLSISFFLRYATVLCCTPSYLWISLSPSPCLSPTTIIDKGRRMRAVVFKASYEVFCHGYVRNNFSSIGAPRS